MVALRRHLTMPYASMCRPSATRISTGRVKPADKSATADTGGRALTLLQPSTVRPPALDAARARFVPRFLVPQEASAGTLNCRVRVTERVTSLYIEDGNVLLLSARQKAKDWLICSSSTCADATIIAKLRAHKDSTFTCVREHAARSQGLEPTRPPPSPARVPACSLAARGALWDLFGLRRGSPGGCGAAVRRQRRRGGRLVEAPSRPRLAPPARAGARGARRPLGSRWWCATPRTPSRTRCRSLTC
jgi:hypothetical protein